MNHMKKTGFLAIPLILVLLISGCQKATPTVDPALKITEIAATVQAEITQNAMLTPSATATATITPTATPLPPTPTLSATEATETVQPTARVEATSKLDDAVWVGDSTIPDGTIIKPGTTFVKTWAIKNTGLTEWPTSYRLVYLAGLQGANGTLNVHIPNTLKPAMVINVSVTFIAPTTEGKYTSYWRLYNSDKQPFGEEMSLVFYVGNP